MVESWISSTSVIFCKILFFQAIYGDQIREVAKSEGAWNPLDFVISLGPQQGSVLQEAHTFVDLHITCSENYPDE